MPAFRTSGTTGQAPTTNYFGALLPDSLNALQSWYSGSSVPGTLVRRDFNGCALLNQWVPYNTNMDGGADSVSCSFTTFTTAPDGTTNTAQLMQDTTANVKHYVTAGTLGVNSLALGRIKLAGIFKYAGYRVVLQFMPVRNLSTVGGCYAIFDLLNGSIGVAATTFNTGGTFESYDNPISEMVALGNGWYRCSLECFAQPAFASVTGGILCAIMLDNGLGTAARSVTFAGTGSNGVYGWRTNALPARAYALNSTSFFDDFNSASTIDSNNTGNPSCNWFVNGRYPCPALHFLPSQGVDPTVWNVSGSALNLLDFVVSVPFSTLCWVDNNGVPVPQSADIIITAGGSWTKGTTTITMGSSNPGSVTAGMNVFNVGTEPKTGANFQQIGVVSSYVGTTLTLTLPARQGSQHTNDQLWFQNPLVFPQNSVGKTFKRPCLLEFRCNTDNISAAMGGIEQAIWAQTANYNLWDVTGAAFPGMEIDYFDTEPAAAPDIDTAILLVATKYGDGYGNGSVNSFNLGGTLLNLGITDWTTYRAYGTGKVVCHPPGSGTFYISDGSQVFGVAPPSTGWSVYTGPPTGREYNPRTYHTYSLLMLPYVPGDTGFTLSFTDGILNAWANCYSPVINPQLGLERISQTADAGLWPIFLALDGDKAIGATAAIDWVRVTQ